MLFLAARAGLRSKKRAQFDNGSDCVSICPLVLGRGGWARRSAEKLYTEPMKLTKSEIEAAQASVVAPRLPAIETDKWEEAVGNRGFLPDNLQLLPDKWRGKPALTAYYRLLPDNVFLRAKRSLEPRWGSLEGGFAREKVRIVTGCYAEVRESSHRTGP